MHPLTRGRRVGIDFGEVRIGVAVTDPDAILASPLETLIKNPSITNELSRIFKDYEPIYVAIGNPIHLSGADSDKSNSVRRFALSLKDLYHGKIYLIDERLSTNQSLSQLHEVGKGVKESKNFLDQMAAVNILNQALLMESSINGLGESL